MAALQSYAIVSAQRGGAPVALDALRCGDQVDLELADGPVCGRVEQLSRSLGSVMTVWLA